MKVLVGVSFSVLLVSLFFTMASGINARKVKVRNISDEHRDSAKRSFWIMIIAIVVTEVMVRFGGGLVDKPLFAIHMCFAVPFAILLTIMRFWVTGRKYPAIHWALAYACLSCFLISFITGMILLSKFK